MLDWVAHAHAHHRLLPLSPTRRSSDLEPCPDCARGRSKASTLSILLRVTTLHISRRVLMATPPETVARLHNRVQPADKPGIDRKSTRLNSSHVETSYAVFCLKKKRSHS